MSVTQPPPYPHTHTTGLSAQSLTFILMERRDLLEWRPAAPHHQLTGGGVRKLLHSCLKKLTKIIPARQILLLCFRNPLFCRRHSSLSIYTSLSSVLLSFYFLLYHFLLLLSETQSLLHGLHNQTDTLAALSGPRQPGREPVSLVVCSVCGCVWVHVRVHVRLDWWCWARVINAGRCLCTGTRTSGLRSSSCS